MKQLRNEMIQNAIAYNKYLSSEYLDKFLTIRLFTWTHPRDRMEFAKRYQKLTGENLEDIINQREGEVV
jgi:hypothetical protein